MIAQFKNWIIKSTKRRHRVRVWALIGRAGTGKSFRARLIMEKHNIDLLVDDGLLIRDQQILAGRSAKREKLRTSAVKIAIFENQDRAQIIRDVLDKESYKSILLLGTSEKMVGRIAERLGLPFPDHLIYIEDVATEEEILHARESRQLKGKHVIPVPMIEVKRDQTHRIIDSIKLFLEINPLLFWKKRVVEKTVVQPPFSRRGRLSLSEAALSQMIMHTVQEYSKDVSIKKILIDQSSDLGYEIEVKLQFSFGAQVQNLLPGMQDYIITHIERYSGIHIDQLHLTIDHVTIKK